MTKLGFRIKSYQKAIDEMLKGIDHAFAIMDDIMITGRDIIHHDAVPEKVLRAKSSS